MIVSFQIVYANAIHGNAIFRFFINFILSYDQKSNKKYHTAWKKCVKIGAKNGDNEINNKLNKKDYNSSVIPGALGRLGKHVNKRESLNRMHLLNSFRYVKNVNVNCKNATKY